MTSEKDRKSPEAPSLQDLYPQLTPEELQEAEETLDRYIGHAVAMFERLLADPEAYARFKALTGRSKDGSMEASRTGQHPTGPLSPPT